MSRYIPVTEYVKKRRWCNQNGWTEPFYQERRWYAFPPGAVIPQEIPMKVWERVVLWGSKIWRMILICAAGGLMVLSLKVIVSSCLWLLPAVLFLLVYGTRN